MLVLGLTVQGARAAGMSGKSSKHADAMAAHMSVAATGDMRMCGKCDGCKNGRCKSDNCLSSGGCSGYCSNLSALPVFGALIATPLSGPGAIVPVRYQTGWAAPPDPYPPRTTILG
jgi:hypothetical protein